MADYVLLRRAVRDMHVYETPSRKRRVDMACFEITGGGVENKGAQLMLRTAADAVARYVPGARFAVEPRSAGEFSKRGREGFYQITPLWFGVSSVKARVANAAFGIADRFLPDYYRRHYGMVRRSDCAGMIDVSGLAYCDLFPSHYAQDAAAMIRKYYYGRAPVVFLPQMVGPFTDRHAAGFRRLYEVVSLFFVRDRVSYEHASAALPNADRLRQAPDITIFTHDVVCSTPLAARRYACIVPNHRMLDTAREDWGAEYRAKLLSACKRFSECGLKVFLVVHDTSGDDYALVQDLLQHAQGSEVEIYSEDDVATLKAFIAGARCAVASRYHSLVAALSCGVPSIALGWAHKYDTLLEEFGVQRFNLAANCKREIWDARLDDLLSDESAEAARAEILRCKADLEPHHQNMWDEVIACLTQSRAGRQGL